MAVCIKCGAETKATYKFCMSCGYPVKQAAQINTQTNPVKEAPYNPGTRTREVQRSACIRCGSKLSPIDSFCMSCGYPVNTNTKAQTQNNQYQGNAAQQANPVHDSFPICKKCGARIEITDAFCMACGYPTKPQTQSQPLNERNQCIAELDKLCEYFGKVKSDYEDYDHCYRVRTAIKKEIENERSSDFQPAAGFISMCVIGTIIALIGLFNWTNPYFSYAWILFIFGNLIAAGGVFLMVLYIKRIKARRRKLKMINDQQVALAKELTINYVNYGYCIVDPEFTNPKILSRIRENMRSGRAKDLNDAIKYLYRDARRKEFLTKKELGNELKFFDRQGANSVSAFYPAQFFNL